MIFKRNEGLNSSFQFCFKGSAVRVQLAHAYRKVDKMSVQLEAREMFVSLRIGVSIETAAVVCAILERISGIYPSSDEQRHEKTGFLHMRKQRRRPASR